MATILFDQHLGEVVYIPQLDLLHFEVGWRISESWHGEGKHTYKPREVDMLLFNTPLHRHIYPENFCGIKP